MEKRSKIKHITGDGSFDSDYGDSNGKLYKYLYSFENGEEGACNHKTSGVDSLKLKIGDEVLYTLEETNYGNKVKFVQENSFQGGGAFKSAKNDPKIQEYIIRQSSLQRATEYFTLEGFGDSDKPKYIQVMQLADIYVKYVLSGDI